MLILSSVHLVSFWLVPLGCGQSKWTAKKAPSSESGTSESLLDYSNH